MPGFAAFYEAIHDRLPLPWQTRLAKQVAETEAWPIEVEIPTGLGKTACLDVAVWWLASQADRPPPARSAPTRIWWLAHRPVLAGSTGERARAVSGALRNPAAAGITGDAAAIVRAVADRLRSLGSNAEADPLEVVRHRGGVGARVPTDPSRPVIVLSTVRLFGSRLLFRGQGSNRFMYPVDAAHAGTDSLVLVDESPFARNLLRLVRDLADCTRKARRILGGARSLPQVVSLTATGSASAFDRFGLDAEDRANPIVRERLGAPKWIDARVERGDADKAIAKWVKSLLVGAHDPACCLVFANTLTVARAVFGRLSSSPPADDADILLAAGRTREREAEGIRARILDPVRGMPASPGPPLRRDRHLVVVATPALEADADLDAQFVVSEACGVRALTQRLGRLNRLGRFSNSRAVYVHASGRAGRRPPGGGEPEAVLRRLQKAAKRAGGPLSVSPRHLAEVLGEPDDEPGRVPEVMNGLLWEWTKTTTPPRDAAPVTPYFAGIPDAELSVCLFWRANVPDHGRRIRPRARDGETVRCPIRQVRRALIAHDDLRRLGPDGLTVEVITARDIRPDDTLVLPSDRGLLDDFGWNPDSTAPVADVSVPNPGTPPVPAADLELHGRAVGARARLIAERLGLAPALIRAVDLAGQWHDLGKADRRFRLRPAGWPRGGRHEQLSARLLQRWLSMDPDRPDSDLADLLVHLVASHHGCGRPLVTPVPDDTTEEVSATMRGTTVRCPANLSETDWGQPARFRRLNDTFGPWGLALLETIVRQANRGVSDETRVSGTGNR
ncbi:MAG: CRISPR-associated endonuclease Cas3'' [Gemmatimonadota bacterium]|nr:CRISPR-associated endonuclease Cas3'' [Gemmatimonadota bacterium]